VYSIREWADIILNKNVKITDVFHTLKNILSSFVHNSFYIPVSDHFSLAKIIHPPDSIIITQVHLVLGTIKGNSKMCSVVTTHLP
jgi:hypothetical protein